MIPPGQRDAFFSLMDVMPTLSAIAQIPIKHAIDGMDLSYTFFGKPGKDRQYFDMAFEGDVYFVRDKRFRLHEDGRMYDVSVTSDESRYSMESLVNKSHRIEVRKRLQEHLDTYMKIQKTDETYRVFPFGTGGDNFKNAQDEAKRKKINTSN